MINQVNMDGVSSYGTTASVPKGGYVVRILGVTVKQNSKGQYLELGCDIAEGEYAGIFLQDFRGQTSEPKKWHCNAFVNVPLGNNTEQDGWTKRAFKTFYESLEASNPNYHFDWDETKIKGLMVGALFSGREYRGNDGNVYEAVAINGWTSVDNIRTGKYKLLKDKHLKEQAAGGSFGGNVSVTSSSPNGFSVPGADDDLPF